MTRKTTGILFLIAILASYIAPATAHHSFIAQYDNDQPVTLTGFVTHLQWTNPHVYIYIDVENTVTGAIENWGIEMGPPHMLQRRGWKKNTLQAGDEIRIEGSRARDGSLSTNARTVTVTATGQILGAASSGPGTQGARTTGDAASGEDDGQ